MNVRKKSTKSRSAAAFSPTRDSRFKLRAAATLALCAAALATQPGCSKRHYREAADTEVYNLLNTVGKSSEEKYWEMDGFTLNESSCSRYANRYNPDEQPSPVDDQTAGRLMANVEGPMGLQKWTKNGFTQQIDNAAWRNTLPQPNAAGEIVIDQKVAFDLALLHSPAYRSALENVYMAALSVTQERYAFDLKFYGGSSLFYQNSGAGEKGARRGTLSSSNSLGVSRRLATGADVVFDIANQLVWTFSPDGQSFQPSTSLSYSIAQPLLRGAGRAIVLESLTRSERQLLANVRQLAFYQQGFYVGVLTGSSPVQAPSGSGYPGGGVGNAQVGGFYGLLSSQVRIRNQAANVVSTEDNYYRYEEYFATSRVTSRTDVDRMRQTWLSSQKSLIELKDNYQNSVESYMMALGLPPDIENVVIRDPLIEQFTFMPSTLENFQANVTTLLSWLRNKNNKITSATNRRYVQSVAELGSGSTVSQISLADLRGIAGELDMQFGAGLQETLADVVKLEKEVAPRRRAALDTMRVRFEEENPELDSSFADYRLFDDRVAAIRADLDREREEINEYGVVTKARGVKYDLAKMFDLIEQTILEYPPDVLAAKIAEKRSDETATPFPPSVEQLVVDLHMESELNDPIQFNADEIERELAELDAMMLELTPENRATYAQRRDELDKSLSALKSGVLARDDIYRFWFTSCLTKLSDELMTLRLIQARARLETIELAIVDVQPTLAFQVARERRLDWMNQRASLVDEWRNIGIVADQLRSDMRLSFDATTRNEGSNPLDFSARNTTLNVGVKFDAPLDRFLERNSYRRALISYDRARRNYYAYVDDVHQQIRSAIRSIQLAQISFELQRDSVLTSIKQVHSAQLALTKPPTGSSKVGSVNTSAEALVNALQSLLNSQNEIMQTWLQYQSQRMNLMLLLGIFHLDETGRWIDPGSIDANLIHSELAGATQTQDELAGMSNLPSFEQLSGGRTPDEIRQLGSEDLESLPAVPEGVARAVSGVPSASDLNAPLANAAVGTDVPMVATLSPR